LLLIPILERDAGGVGVGFFAEIDFGKFDRDACGLGMGEAILQACIVRGPIEYAGDQRPIGGVALAGGGEGAMQLDERRLRRTAQEASCDAADAGGSRRMATGGADHGGADNVEGGEGHGL